MNNVVHHIELWTTDVAGGAPSFEWLFTELGWAAEHDPAWPAGRTWRHASGVYVVLEQSPDVTGPHDRTRAGMNHLAVRVPDRGLLNRIRTDCTAHGWAEMFTDRYPHAGGPHHTALFLENDEGFEMELVVEATSA